MIPVTVNTAFSQAVRRQLKPVGLPRFSCSETPTPPQTGGPQAVAAPTVRKRTLLSLTERSALETIIPTLRKIDKRNATSIDGIVNSIYRKLHPRERGVIVYGGSKIKEGTPEYQMAYELGQAIGNTQLAGGQAHIVTGGGPGAMRASAQGALSVKAHSVGSAMHFIGEVHEPELFPEFYIHPNFNERIDGRGGYLHRGAYTMVLPGGFGTLREVVKIAEELAFNNTIYPAQKQVVLINQNNFFTDPNGFIPHLDYLIAKKLARPELRAMFKIVNTPAEAVQAIQDPNIPWTPGQEKP
ncbi:MAG: LOG family protein [Cyanobacteria bacterium]|nr:LOG family protein [Cyanobacteriota bacterium]